jgi:hypothetical protein
MGVQQLRPIRPTELRELEGLPEKSGLGDVWMGDAAAKLLRQRTILRKYRDLDPALDQPAGELDGDALSAALVERIEHLNDPKDGSSFGQRVIELGVEIGIALDTRASVFDWAAHSVIQLSSRQCGRASGAAKQWSVW